MPGGQHEPQLRRGPQDQRLQLPQRAGAQLLHVIDHQPDPVIQGGQIGQQPLGDHPPVQVRRRRQRTSAFWHPGMSGRLNSARVAEIDGDHEILLTAPDRLADALHDAANTPT
jgi:hypothetical protein